LADRGVRAALAEAAADRLALGRHAATQCRTRRQLTAGHARAWLRRRPQLRYGLSVHRGLSGPSAWPHRRGGPAQSGRHPGSCVISAVAARKVTSTIPIVCPALADAVHLGLIESEARPGKNVTGIEPYIAGLPAKQIEFAREIVPGAKTIGL